jgi:hypothetical protein
VRVISLRDLHRHNRLKLGTPRQRQPGSSAWRLPVHARPGTTLCRVMTQTRRATRLNGTREQAGAQSPELMTAPDLSDAPGG